MKIVQASARIAAHSMDMLETIELCGRVCYKSEDRICEGSAEKMIGSLMDKHHESVIEHGSITAHIICDRGVSHELVRHRLASFSQESTRYCNYSKDKFGEEITVIDIRGGFPDIGESAYNRWATLCELAETTYAYMISHDRCTAQEARSVLPNSLKTEMYMTANPREWRHVFKMRTAKSAHPQAREVMIPLLHEFQAKWPVLFSDIKELA